MKHVIASHTRRPRDNIIFAKAFHANGAFSALTGTAAAATATGTTAVQHGVVVPVVGIHEYSFCRIVRRGQLDHWTMTARIGFARRRRQRRAKGTLNVLARGTMRSNSLYTYGTRNYLQDPRKKQNGKGYMSYLPTIADNDAVQHTYTYLANEPPLYCFVPPLNPRRRRGNLGRHETVQRVQQRG
jgi:hypothetical protein